ncbi:hypothetical protein MNBD_ALPHA09-1885 [hydrothermal vent metagenome]|uniref:Uncharacterized protein n=1 Tax=hydrothermal vent metagenome TaxID=652676 RepID=A0A3B0T6Z5_9ZZZZ
MTISQNAANAGTGGPYGVKVEWVGNTGCGTSAPDAYRPDHWIGSDMLAPVPGTADRGPGVSPYRYNPEQLLVASISSAHMLAYLDAAAEAGIVVTAYIDRASAQMVDLDGHHEVQSILLTPQITLADGTNLEAAEALHTEAHIRSATAATIQVSIGCEPVIGYGADLEAVA